MTAPGSRRLFRVRWWSVGLAVVLAVMAMGVPAGAAPVQAAADPLRLAVATTYRIDPAGHAVHVALEITATNNKPNTATTIYWYDSLTFGVQAQARNFAAVSRGSRLGVTLSGKVTARRATVRIPNLYHGQTRRIRFTFDLPGGKPRSTSPIRVGPGHVEFTAWAWGQSGLGDVTLILPNGYTGQVVSEASDAGGHLSMPDPARTVWKAAKLGDPVRWYAVFSADRLEALKTRQLELPDRVYVRAWPGDGAWLNHVSDVLTTGFPALESAIGLPWPLSSDLTVTEVASSAIKGYGGLFDAGVVAIQITEDLDDHLFVHEASHAWFNASLFGERWINEGLADTYASTVVAARDGKHATGPHPVKRTDVAAFALNAWPPPSRIDDDTEDAEQYGYDASWFVVRSIVSEVSEARMREIFQAARGRMSAYRGAGQAEAFVVRAPDWRTFLDYLEEIGGSTAGEALFVTWVLTPAEVTELRARDSARIAYATLVEDGDGWAPGIVIRKSMSLWQFDEATARMADAEALLADRDTLLAATAALDLPAQPSLETRYEAAYSEEQLAELDADIDDWIAATGTIGSAREAIGRERPLLVGLGLLGAASTPEAGFAGALAAFRAGDRAGAIAQANAAVGLLAGAEEIGRGRAMTAGAATLVVLLIVLALAAIWWRRRRRRRARAVLAGGDSAAFVPGGEAGALVAAPDAYATLAATPDPHEAAQPGGAGDTGAKPD